MRSQNSYPQILTALPDAVETEALAERLFSSVFRTGFDQPGFALLSLAPGTSSTELRRLMVMLKQALGAPYRRRTGRALVYLSMGRFDQQASTKYHLDGAPDESFLMLGYEPSEVPSELHIADYTQAAYDLGIPPKQFLIDFNPMFSRGEQQLSAYSTPVLGFDPQQAHILLINNSCLPFQKGETTFLGVMHQATIPRPQPEKRRIVNSTLLCSAATHDDEPIGAPFQEQFLCTPLVSGPIGTQ